MSATMNTIGAKTERRPAPIADPPTRGGRVRDQSSSVPWRAERTAPRVLRQARRAMASVAEGDDALPGYDADDQMYSGPV